MQFPVLTPPPMDVTTVTPPPVFDDASIPIMMSAEYPEYHEKEMHGVIEMAEEVGIVTHMMRVDPCDYYWWGR